MHVSRYAALPHRAPQPQPLPRVREGQRLSIASLRVEAGTTEPPPPLSESDLISEMETNGIGTDASIATHIKNVEARKYVRLLAGRRLEPTALGLALVQGCPQPPAPSPQPSAPSPPAPSPQPPAPSPQPSNLRLPSPKSPPLTSLRLPARRRRARAAHGALARRAAAE